MTDITVTPATPLDLSTVSTTTAETIVSVTLPAGQYQPVPTHNVSAGLCKIFFEDLATGAGISDGAFGANGYALFPEFLLTSPTDIRIRVIQSTTTTGELTSIKFVQTAAAGTTEATTRNTYTFRSWKDTVLAYTERADDLEGEISTILAPVQMQLARELMARSGDSRTTLSISNARATLPNNYQDLRIVLHKGVPLAYVPLADYHRFRDRYPSAVSPPIYAIDGDSLIIGTVSETTLGETVEVVYHGGPGTLVNDTDTHDLLNEAFDLYVHAGCMAVYTFVVEFEEAERARTSYMEGREAYNQQQKRSRVAVSARRRAPRPGPLA